jgi:RimJ/RimL family protein N-acetyltransferase
VIETERLVLRPVEAGDVDGFLELVGDEQVMEWLGEQAGGRELAARLVGRWVRRWELNGVGPFAILLDGRVIGRTGLLIWDARTWEPSTYEAAGEHAVDELGWAVASRYWGHGYATEAARAARSWAYAERGVERLLSLIEPRNVRSARVAEKLGAVPDAPVDSPYGPMVPWVHPR